MKPATHIAFVFFVLGALSFTLYAYKGSYVAADGRLVESFGYIPLGYLAFLIGLLILGISALVSKRRQH